MPPSPICCSSLYGPDHGAGGFGGGYVGASRRQNLVQRWRRGDGRPVQETSWVVVCFQQRIDPLPQLGISAALAVEEGGTAGSACFFGGCNEDGLNSLQIDGHGVTLHLGSPYSATFGAGLSKKKKNQSSPRALRSQARA